LGKTTLCVVASQSMRSFNEDGVFYDAKGGIFRGRDEIDRIAGAIKATHGTRLQKIERVVGGRLGLCGGLPELNLVPIQIIDPGKATVGFIHSFGIDLYSLLL
jgi:hypothetical protein